MTQSPHSGQTAPHDAGFGPVTTTQTARTSTDQGVGGSGSSGSWAPPGASASGGQASTADTTTTALPQANPGGSGSGAQRAANTGAPSGAPTASSAPTSTPAGSRARAPRTRGPRRAQLQLRHINPWTVLKFSCVLSVALFFVWLITIGVLYGVLDGAGIIGKINDAVTTLQGGNATDPVTAGVVFGSAAIVGVINMVLFVALSTIGSLVYNLCADLVGGIEITLSER